MSPKTSYAADRLRLLSLALAAPLALAACQATPVEPAPDKPNPPATPQPVDHGGKPPQQGGATMSTAQPEPPRRPTLPPLPRPGEPSPDDPVHGKFTLEDATKGLPPGKQLLATIETSMGKIECKLFDDKAPITVANFVGLARGLRPWKTPGGTWEKKAAYDGTTFHRIIKGFMIQGGDAQKNGTGEPGYVIPDEKWDGAKHDRAGLLCMANRGPNTNGAQFFITDASAPHLDRSYTIFGECGPEALIHKIAEVPVTRDKPETPPDIKKVTITRK